MDHEDITCTTCGCDIHWLEVFPNNTCLGCYEKKMDAQTPQQMHDTIMQVFGNR